MNTDIGVGAIILILGFCVGVLVSLAIPSRNPQTCLDPQIKRVDIRYFYENGNTRITRYTTVIDCNGGLMTYTLDTDKPVKEIFTK